MSGFPLPSVTPPTLSNWQISYNGLTVGQSTPYGVQTLDGLDLPQVRSGDVARPRTSGEFVGLDLLGGREVTITMDAVTDGTSLQHALQALATAFAPPADGQTETPLWLQLPNLPLLVLSARVRKRQIPIDVPWSVGNFAAKVTIALHATDPRVYGPSVGSMVTLPAPPGGLTFPVTFPATFGGGSAGGDINVNNTGNTAVYPVIVIVGPVTNPSVTNQTTGQELSFSNPNQIGYTLNQGDQLVVDTDAHTVVYIPNGSTVGTSVRNWLVFGSTWWSLAPGTSQVQFDSGDATLPSPAPTCTLDWAPAYLSAT